MTDDDVELPGNMSPRDMIAFAGWLDAHDVPMLAGLLRDAAEERLHDFYGDLSPVRLDPVTGTTIPKLARRDPSFLWGCELCRERYGMVTSTA